MLQIIPIIRERDQFIAWFAEFFSFALILCVAFAVAGAGAWFQVARGAAGRVAHATADVAPATAGIVLGTSRLVSNGRSNLFFKHRIEAAAALFHAGKVEYLIVSGNQQNGGRARGGYDEPADMRDALIARGVPADRIYRDRAGFRTLDSVLRARDIFGQERAIVISQGFHVERALFLARAHGLEFTGFAAADVPEFYGLRVQAREFAARLAAVFDVAVNRRAKVGGPMVMLGKDAAG